MKIQLKMYITQPRKGQYEASVPWIPELATPVRGPSPAALKEELMFRLLELVHGGWDTCDLDRIIPLQDAQVVSVYIELERKHDAERPPVPLNTITHVIIGQWPHDEILHMWVPKVPGVCIALPEAEAVYHSLLQWTAQWSERLKLDSLKLLECSYWGRIDEIEIDLGYPEAVYINAQSFKPRGRMRRPEALVQVASNLTHRAEDDALGHAFGRDEIVDQIVEVLMSPRPANVCLIGPPGVGKTALLHEAVRRVFKLQRTYQQRRDFWETSGDRIIAGMSVLGQWEQRVSKMCEELTERTDVLVLSELLGWVRAGQSFQDDSSVAHFMEPYMAQDRFAVITEATAQTWAMARAKAPGVVERFRRIYIPELA